MSQNQHKFKRAKKCLKTSKKNDILIKAKNSELC